MGVLLATAGCQAFVDGDVTGAIGDVCVVDANCQGGECRSGVCTRACSSDVDCPSGSACVGAGFCEIPVRAGFVYPGEPSTNTWARAHDLARLDLNATLPYLATTYRADAIALPDVGAAIDDLAARGANLVFVTTLGADGAVKDAALRYPSLELWTAHGPGGSATSHGYFGRVEQAFYLAGYVAAKASQKHRLGVLASYVTPWVVRDVNAFALGARIADPMAVTEVRFVGYYEDPNKPDKHGKSKERVETELLLASGCDVVLNHADNDIAITTIESTTALSIGYAAADACPTPSKRCLGSVVWNFEPLYQSIFESWNQRVYAPKDVLDGIRISPTESMFSFVASPLVPTAVKLSVGTFTQKMATTDPLLPFEGPFCAATTQHDLDKNKMPDCVAAMKTLDQASYDAMCWFVQGVVQKSDPANAASPDVAANVPMAGDCTSM